MPVNNNNNTKKNKAFSEFDVPFDIKPCNISRLSPIFKRIQRRFRDNASLLGQGRMTKRVNEMPEDGQGGCVALFVAQTQGYFQNVRYLNIFKPYREANFNPLNHFFIFKRFLFH